MRTSIPVLTVLLTAALVLAQDAPKPPAAPKAPASAKAQGALAPVADDPALPRVLIIGDSISIGYTLPTRELLKSKANLHRIPTNGGPTINGLKNIDKWLGDGKWDVIHFNFGLHDMRNINDKPQVALDQYEKNLAELIARMKKTGAKIIFATTTPVPEGELNPKRTFAALAPYNAAATKVAKENGLAINDLCALITPKCKEVQIPHDVHFKPEGSKILAEQVAKTIEAALAK